MQLQIGYRTAYDYFKETLNQASKRTEYGDLRFVDWDDSSSYGDIARTHEADFIASIGADPDDIDHRIEFGLLRFGNREDDPVVKLENKKILYFETEKS